MWPFKKKPEKVWKYIGYVDCGKWHRREPDGSVNKNQIVGSATLLYYMTDDGERHFKANTYGSTTIETLKRNDIERHYEKADRWVAGGSFPEEFKPEGDTLGEMLSRLVQAKLEGKDE